jgi:hypothetical protein
VKNTSTGILRNTDKLKVSMKKTYFWRFSTFSRAWKTCFKSKFCNSELWTLIVNSSNYTIPLSKKHILQFFFRPIRRKNQKFQKKTSINFCVWKKYYSVPHFFCPMPITRKVDDRVHPIYQWHTWKNKSICNVISKDLYHIIINLTPSEYFTEKCVKKCLWRWE